ncbi:MAG: DUF805 domain-containing protein [Rhodospirillales bacterium]|nr:DUF805 domain-containing protein [Rhodospirillales bacterium]MBO6787216.1 DUF805 domain-containing protein [Rhodospirillales bacterium]
MDGALIFILVIAAAALALHIYGVRSENSRLRATRMDFFKWVAAIFIIQFMIGFVFGAYSGYVVNIASLLFAMAVAYPFAQVLVRRCRDAGWTKGAAYACAVPYLGTFISLVLLFKGSEPGPLRPDLNPET